MNLFSRSNQNGAPSESASAVMIQPRNLSNQSAGSTPRNCRGSVWGLFGSPRIHPIGRPSLSISLRLLSTRHLASHGVGLGVGFEDAVSVELVLDGEVDGDAFGDGDGDAPGEADGDASGDGDDDAGTVGAGLLAAYWAAAATNESRLAPSVERMRIKAIESTLRAMEITSPRIITISCERRL